MTTQHSKIIAIELLSQNSITLPLGNKESILLISLMSIRLLFFKLESNSPLIEAKLSVMI